MKRYKNKRPGLSIAARARASLERYLQVEAVSGVVLLFAAAIALIWANSPWHESYTHVWHTSLSMKLGELELSKPLHFWINDALMTLFFLVVGMEIRREIHEGSLSQVKQAMLPMIAALGGVVVPALIYLSINSHPIQQNGWAVPTATDIAFAVGVLALLGRAIPANIRIFLLTLAIVDDIIAVMIIALFYSGGLNYGGFLIAGLGVMLVLGFQRIGIRSAWGYVLPGAIIWIGMLMTGAHPTLAGVVLGLMTPVTSIEPVQKALHPWVSYGVMPLFALANAGVIMSGSAFSAGAELEIITGVVLALVLGKPLGIMSLSWISVRMGWCQLPDEVTWKGLLVAGLLAGIGFTMSIFIAMLAFEEDQLLNAAKTGVLLASFIAAVLGLVWGKIYIHR